MGDPVNVQEQARQLLVGTEKERAAAPKPALFGPDGRPISSADAAQAKPKLFEGSGAPVRRSIKAEDIEGFDASKPQFIYAKTADGKPADHGNDYRFYVHELDPVKMKEVDPKAVFVGKTTPQRAAPRIVHRAPPTPRNRKERRAAEARSRKRV